MHISDIVYRTDPDDLRPTVTFQVSVDLESLQNFEVMHGTDVIQELGVTILDEITHVY